jgi:hypothetical protein
MGFQKMVVVYMEHGHFDFPDTNMVLQRWVIIQRAL